MFNKLSLESVRITPWTAALIISIVAVFNPSIAIVLTIIEVANVIVQAQGLDLSFGGLFMVFLLCLVGLYISPSIASAVTSAALNFTGAAKQLLLLFPLIWVALMIAIPIVALVAWFKRA